MHTGQTEKITYQANSLLLLQMVLDAVQLRALETLNSTSSPAADSSDGAKSSHKFDLKSGGHPKAPKGMEIEMFNALNATLPRNSRRSFIQKALEKMSHKLRPTC